MDQSQVIPIIRLDQSLKYHGDKYNTALLESAKPYNMQSIEDFFKKNPIQIVKLNHCLREKEPTEFEALLQLSPDGEYF